MHGIFGDENSLIGDENNKIKEITADLVAQEQTKDMIVVFPNMYAETDPNQQPGFNAEAVLPYDNFINDLVNDLFTSELDTKITGVHDLYFIFCGNGYRVMSWRFGK